MKNLFQNLLEILFKNLCLTRLRALVRGCYHFCLKGGTFKYAFICREYLWKDTQETEGEGNLETQVKRCLIFHYYFLVPFNFTVSSTCYLSKTAKITTVPRPHSRPINSEFLNFQQLSHNACLWFFFSFNSPVYLDYTLKSHTHTHYSMAFAKKQQMQIHTLHAHTHTIPCISQKKPPKINDSL